MKVRVRRGRVVEIMDRLIAAGGVKDWAPRAFSEFSRTHPLHAVGTRGLPWIEIDVPEDYQRAVRDILPQIDGDPSAGPEASFGTPREWDGAAHPRAAAPLLADAS